jgi:hypothetical protein
LPAFVIDSDDWKEAYEANRKPKYTWHAGKYNAKALAGEVGEWNSMIAGMAGAIKDALQGSSVAMDAPIQDFPNFEELEFKGQNQKYLTPFLTAMKTMADAAAKAD